MCLTYFVQMCVWLCMCVCMQVCVCVWVNRILQFPCFPSQRHLSPVCCQTSVKVCCSRKRQNNLWTWMFHIWKCHHLVQMKTQETYPGSYYATPVDWQLGALGKHLDPQGTWNGCCWTFLFESDCVCVCVCCMFLRNIWTTVEHGNNRNRGVHHCG